MGQSFGAATYGITKALTQESGAFATSDALNIEVSNRSAGDIAEAGGRTAADNTEADIRASADETERVARINGDAAESRDRTIAIANESAARTAAILVETTARNTAISSEATARDVAIATEATARSTGDETERVARIAAINSEASARTAAILAAAETGASIKSKLGINTLSGVNTGDQVIPTALPASDVYPWAKQQNKPTYSPSEVGAAPLSSTIVNASWVSWIDDTDATIRHDGIAFVRGDGSVFNVITSTTTIPAV